MGRGNYYHPEAKVYYVDLNYLELAKDFEKDDTYKNYTEGELLKLAQEVSYYDFKDVLREAVEKFPSFNKIDEFDHFNNCRYIYENTFMKIGLADNEWSIALIFKPRIKSNNEWDLRYVPIMKKILKYLMYNGFDLYFRTSAWTSGKLEDISEVK